MGKILAFFHPNGRLEGYYHQPDKLKENDPKAYVSMCNKGYFIEEAEIPSVPPYQRGKEYHLRLKENTIFNTNKEGYREISGPHLEWVMTDRSLTQEEAIEVMSEKQHETNELLRQVLDELLKQNGEVSR